MPGLFKHFVFEIVLMLDFIQQEKIKVSCSIQNKEESVRAYDSCGEEQRSVEACDREM
jgi:hypothetical protein